MVGAMSARTLGYQTDLFFIEKMGQVESRDRYVVARTPSIPTFRWGNFLLYPDPPSPATSHQWMADFEREFPQANHCTFGWDSEEAGDPSDFIARGLELSDLAVMTAGRVRAPRKRNPAIVVRRLESDADWHAAVENAVRVQLAETPVDAQVYRDFLALRYQAYRALQNSGFGAMYGAFMNGDLAGCLGLFGEARFGRFQAVEVDPRFRRLGVCSTMLYEASQDFLKEHAVERLVILGLNDNPHGATGLYETAGFRRFAQMWGIWKRP